jgi:predicted neutral ceramidase superfamily lipid hydrolase
LIRRALLRQRVRQAQEDLELLEYERRTHAARVHLAKQRLQRATAALEALITTKGKPA